MYGLQGATGPHLRPGQPPRLLYGLQGATDFTYALASRLVYLYGLQGATDFTYALASRLVYLYGLHGATDFTYALASRLVYLHRLRGLVTLRLVFLVRCCFTRPPRYVVFLVATYYLFVIQRPVYFIDIYVSSGGERRVVTSPLISVASLLPATNRRSPPLDTSAHIYRRRTVCKWVLSSRERHNPHAAPTQDASTCHIAQKKYQKHPKLPEYYIFLRVSTHLYQAGLGGLLL
ncbi:hypothetical protein GWK47_000366 [Chionoecetes opilio]|uniref:Uncharacterized protein n=1 Tax=Chionoecetes opilio TaxID=41210 RepID=A0A8J4YIF9_CHIOP|nr:hypothetical protein GWK47_000366 [Chionoecetes opilio]